MRAPKTPLAASPPRGGAQADRETRIGLGSTAPKTPRAASGARSGAEAGRETRIGPGIR
jgi:hypothetical protein